MSTKPGSSEANNASARLKLESKDQLPLVKTNFIIMAVAAVMIILGFVLITGAPSTETEFNPDIFSTRRIIVGPTIAFLGFIVMAVGIIWRVKGADKPEQE